MRVEIWFLKRRQEGAAIQHHAILAILYFKHDAMIMLAKPCTQSHST